IARPFDVVDRTDDVAANLDRPRHAAKDVDRFLADRHPLGDRLAALRDDDRYPALRALVHHAQAVGLEFACWDLMRPFVHVAPRWSSAMVRIARRDGEATLCVARRASTSGA